MPEAERLHLEQQEEDVLRELRLFLRNVTERLSLDRRFKAFAKPVDTEEVPDYMMVVRKPMDFSTLLTNIDQHRYVTVGEFMFDADFIWQNALEYNPDTDPMDRHIRHRACALKDTVRAILRDELDEDFERVCEEIKESRMRRAAAYISEDEYAGCSYRPNTPRPRPKSSLRARKKIRHKPARKSAWSNGVIRKAKKKKKAPQVTITSSTSSSSVSVSVSADLSSESSYGNGQQQHLDNGFNGLQNGAQNGLQNGVQNGVQNGLQNGVPVNGLDDSDGYVLLGHENGADTDMTTAVNGFSLNSSEVKSSRVERSPTKEVEKTPKLVVDHSKLRDVLNKAVAKTDGMEVEPLEKLYALLAQCIYRHRASYNKTELILEMKKEISSFS